jgi:hypothetical protein
MSKLRELQRNVTEGLYAWMLYEFSCNKADLFNEKYLAYPIGNILNHNTDQIQHILVEQNHPLKNSSSGRPIQVDFVIKEKYNSKTWEVAVEMKWLGNQSLKFNDLIWDLVRLQNLFIKFENIKCYFLIVGNHKKLATFISQNEKNSITGKTVISKNSKTLKFYLNNLSTSEKEKLNRKIKKYPAFNLFSQIVCTPPHSYPKQDIYNMTFGTMMFEILKPDKTLKIGEL